MILLKNYNMVMIAMQSDNNDYINKSLNQEIIYQNYCWKYYS